MPETKYKLWYFNFRGRAEPIRLLLTCAGIPFEDYQFETDKWSTIKPTIPGGRVPVLQVTGPDGKDTWYQESMAIARLFAKKHNMFGSTDEDYYHIERILGECEDVYRELYMLFRTPEAEKAAKIKEFQEGYGKVLLNIVQNSLESTGGKHVAANRITLGDLFLYSTMDLVISSVPGFLDKEFPKLKQFHDTLPTLCPRLEAYAKSRAKTVF